jgi:glycoside/pentoside/hexuronide:cation symporter, GPH family
MNTRERFAYGAFALPLAMAALPVYVMAPKLYGDLGVPLSVLGATLLAARLVDTVQDPLFGYWSDVSRWGRPWLIVLALPFLATGFWALLNPPAWDGADLVGWLLASTLLAYSGYSLVSISYTAWGADAAGARGQARMTGVREAFTLSGVLLAVTVPELLRPVAGETVMATFSWTFVALLLAGTVILLAAVPAPRRRTQSHRGPRNALGAVLADRRFRQLAIVFVLNGMAAAVPATLVLFYVEHVLARPQLSGLFLGVYFLAGIAGMPLWVRMAGALGTRGAWLVAMGLAMIAFPWAGVLPPGAVVGFLMICAVSGLALGADLALAPALLGERVHEAAAPPGAYFGLWSLFGKLSLALAAGFALPIVEVLGFDPITGAGAGALALTYAGLPCLLKLAAAGCLWRLESHS